MSNSKQANFYPLPTGEVTTYNPDGATRVSEDFTSRNSLTDASYVHGGPNACGYGAFGNHPGPYDTGNADVTTATPRRKPDYGIG